jgi:hypothetical protein
MRTPVSGCCFATTNRTYTVPALHKKFVGV